MTKKENRLVFNCEKLFLVFIVFSGVVHFVNRTLLDSEPYYTSFIFSWSDIKPNSCKFNVKPLFGSGGELSTEIDSSTIADSPVFGD